MTITDVHPPRRPEDPRLGLGGSRRTRSDIRDGGWVGELDGECLKGWLKGIRAIIRE
jgi:hypothetical protein